DSAPSSERQSDWGSFRSKDDQEQEATTDPRDCTTEKFRHSIRTSCCWNSTTCTQTSNRKSEICQQAQNPFRRNINNLASRFAIGGPTNASSLRHGNR